jgi:predicted amidohydrolase
MAGDHCHESVLTMRRQRVCQVGIFAMGLAGLMACGGAPLEKRPPPKGAIPFVVGKKAKGTAADAPPTAPAANVLGIQPHLFPHDYEDGQKLYSRLGGYLSEARRAGLMGEKTVVVFPEYVGTWLVVANEGTGVLAAPKTGDAMQSLALSHPFSFLWRVLNAPEGKDGMTHAAFSFKAALVAQLYQEVMGKLARDFKITLVGGSILLPHPTVEDGRIVVDPDAPLENVSFLFRPDGVVSEQVVRKVFVTKNEKPFLASGNADDLPVFDTPAGKLGVLICADAWYPQAWKALGQKGAEIVVVPSYVDGDGTWNKKWGGFSGWPAPDDVKATVPEKVGAITEGDAWQEFTLRKRIPQIGAKAGLIVNLRGGLWDLGSDGQALVFKDNTLHLGPFIDGPALINLWLD